MGCHKSALLIKRKKTTTCPINDKTNRNTKPIRHANGPQAHNNNYRPSLDSMSCKLDGPVNVSSRAPTLEK